MLRDNIERFSKVTHRCDIVAAQSHDKLPEHYQIFLDLLRRYGHTGHARGDAGLYVSTSASPHELI
jgi:hypothetical protein